MNVKGVALNVAWTRDNIKFQIKQHNKRGAHAFAGPGGEISEGVQPNNLTPETGLLITSECDCGVGGGYVGYFFAIGYFNSDNIIDVVMGAGWAYSNNPERISVLYGKGSGFPYSTLNVNAIPEGAGLAVIDAGRNHTGPIAVRRFNHENTDDLVFSDGNDETNLGRLIVIYGREGVFDTSSIFVSSLTRETGLIKKAPLQEMGLVRVSAPQGLQQAGGPVF